MSASEGMYDVALKPKLLRSLLREYVPDEKHPFSNPSELLYVVSTVKTHKLLSEWAPLPLEQDLVDAWKSAVDSWVHRLLTLASSSLPDKCWAGICLLGLTCQECSSERFLASYAVWLNKLVSNIQPPVGSHLLKAASCASLSDMFTRLSGFSNAKKDGSSQATKIIQPALKLLNEDSSAVVLEEAVCLLCTMINFFPLSVHRHYDSVEAAIVSKLMSGKCCANVLKKLGYVLSLLPKSRGDEDSWSLMMDKIVLCLNSQLNDAFQGLEEEVRSAQTLRALLPPGKESPPPLGGLASEQTSDLSTRKPERLLGSRICTLMQCCCNMLTSSYPVMVPVPVSGLVALVGRVLMVDGSLPPSYSFMTTLKQEFICSEIPTLQLHGLEILGAVVQGLRSQLLPHVAAIVQLLKEYLRRCKFPDLKIKAYAILKVLLMSMGIGIAIHIGQDIVSNVFIDLDFFSGEKDGKSSRLHAKAQTELSSESRLKKRKHSSLASSFQAQPVQDGLEVEMLHNLSPISVKIAALEALEALLTVGGSMRSESWRVTVDHLLITVATNACKGGWSKEERSIFLSGDRTATWADFQLASLRALLASLLSPGRVRPAHLALGLELFRRGMQETGTKLAEYCGHALLALEVLIHPRALPLLDLHSSTNEYKVLGSKIRDTVYPSGDRQISTYRAGPVDPESEDDDLYENWLGDADELEIQVTESKQNADYTEKPPATATDPTLGELPVKGASLTHSTTKEVEVLVSATGRNDKRMGNTDDYMVESPRSRNTQDQRADNGPGTAVDGCVAVQSGKDALESVDLGRRIASVENDTTAKSNVISEVHGTIASTSEQQVTETKDDGVTTIVKRISATLSNTDRSKDLMLESDNELSSDFPDIVDGDPDSD
ncbi:hypothetical protein Salat_0874800 [Sesamum alatum]|uniref:Pre-rRNA-processing protein RIX1 N-terminal domain-containing protein n=1 Tax=Sesamum alatum TaxID=300844 RepID=A0AAE1YJB0_9LAMI|nr:hypothetical protein Salat_0874800 [Sesamum alatum]